MTEGLLLDTHVFLWLQTSPARVAGIQERLEDPETTLWLSAASSWELAVKYALGRIPLPEPPHRYGPSRARASDVSLLEITHDDVFGVGDLPPHHADPFDRLLVSQARRRRLTLVTADQEMTRYAVPALLVAGPRGGHA